LIEGSDGNFYGVTPFGGTSSVGVLYRITPAGVESVLHAFAGGTADGAAPSTALVEVSGDFYGATNGGGNASCGGGCGTVFKLTAAGAESLLYLFGPSAITGAQPPDPSSLLIAINPQGFFTGNLAGTTTNGGQFGIGTVFTLTPAGVATTLYSFGGEQPHY
jgi:uncharacterized repeat protein (TIGR03803 family)